MTLRSLMLAGPTKANELFARLAETSDGALKTRERLFAELKTELETHVALEEQHLFPVLRKHAETKEIVAAAIRDNKELRAQLAELDMLPKNDEAFMAKLTELKRAFRQHARDETKEILPALHRALSEEQVSGIAEKMEMSLVEAEQAKHDQEQERRAARREQVEVKARQDGVRERQEHAEPDLQQEETAEREQEAAAPRTREVMSKATEAMIRTGEVATEGARQIARGVAESAGRGAARPSAVWPTTGFLFWDLMFGLTGLQPRRREVSYARDNGRNMSGEEQVIPLAEEVLTVGTQKVSAGTTRVRRYVVETPVEKQVTLVRERVVVERRRPVTDKISGELLTELEVEVTETEEVPVVGKTLRLKEEVVVRTERTERVETVRDTVRRDEVNVERADNKRPVRLRASARG